MLNKIKKVFSSFILFINYTAKFTLFLITTTLLTFNCLLIIKEQERQSSFYNYNHYKQQNLSSNNLLYVKNGELEIGEHQIRGIPRKFVELLEKNSIKEKNNSKSLFFNLPETVERENSYLIIKPETNAKSVVYIGLDQINPIPNKFLNNPTIFILDASCVKPGTYKFVAVAADSSGNQTKFDFKLNIKVEDTPKNPEEPLPTPKPENPNPLPQPPPSPPTKPDKNVIVWWLIVVQEDGPVKKEFADYLKNDVWSQLAKEGFRLSRQEYKQLRDDLKSYINGNELPAILIIKQTKNTETNEEQVEFNSKIYPLPPIENLKNVIKEITK